MNNVTRVIFGIGIVLCMSVSVLALSTVGVPAGSNATQKERTCTKKSGSGGK